MIGEEAPSHCATPARLHWPWQRTTIWIIQFQQRIQPLDRFLVHSKSCTNQTNALKFLNFLCKDDIAEKNFEYVQYASPITSVVENQDADVKNNEAVNPSSDTIKRCEIYKALSDDDSAKYTKLWQELLSY